MVQTRTVQPSVDELVRDFADPPLEYRPIDGWWWEAGHLDREKMRWQLEELKDKGIAGTWFYARYLYGEPLGSDPGYFSDGWWEFTRFAAEEQKRLGLINWFSNWTALQFEQDSIRKKRDERPELNGRRLVLYKEPANGKPLQITADDDVLDAAAYRATEDGVDHGTRVDLRDRIHNGRLVWEPPEEGWVVTVVASRPWDLDYLSAKIGSEWTDVVLGEYERRLPDLIGDGLHAFGPDEMAFINGTVVYSKDVLDRLKATVDFDPVPHLIGLFTDIGPRTEQIRCNYHEIVCQLLDENFYVAPPNWLHDRNMIHICLSQMGDNPIQQTYHYADFFRYMRTFEVGGNEDPGPSPVGERHTTHGKVSSSVAHLYDRSRVVLLAHYACGWGHTLEENVTWTNEAYAKGLNLYSRHLGSYSLMGGWFEYVPPHDHWYHPYWRYWKTFTDHVSRLSYVLSQGKHRPDVALLYPLTAIHANWTAGNAKEAVVDDMEDEEYSMFRPGALAASEGAEQVGKTIYDDAIDFDFVDDNSFAQAVVRGDVLDINGIEVRCVVLPPIDTIRRTTLEKISDFHDAGGTVVAVGRLPSATVEGGREDEQLSRLLDPMFGGSSARGFLVEDVAKVPEVISGAITRDVTPSEKGFFQTHQYVDGDTDVYFVFSLREEPHNVTLRLRTNGRVDRWDTHTGERRALKTESDGDVAVVDVHFERYEGIVLVCSPEGTGAEDENEPGEEIDSIELDGTYTFQVEPTMDNRWGDFRYPASERLISAEARRFEYRESEDAEWEEVQYSHGPYFLHVGPFTEGDEPADLLERAKRGDMSLDWQRHTFSKKHGWGKRISREGFFLDWFQHLLGVPENFLVFEDKATDEHHHYVFTTLVAPEDGEYLLAMGRKKGEPELSGLDQDSWFPYRVPPGTRAWINGDEVFSGPDGDVTDIRQKVHLREGRNDVLLKIVHEVDALNSTYAAVLGAEPEEKDPFITELSWFREPQRLAYDIKGLGEPRVGWYRLAGPPGLKSMRLNATADAIDAWIDGEPVEVNDGEITLPAAKARTSMIALRVEQRVGVYGGAVFDEPIEFLCEQGEIPLGDWSERGLPTYSGIGVYGIEFTLTSEQANSRVTLDLGMVMTVAEVIVNGTPAGVKIARPFRLNITDLVREGANTLEVKVANTLANHYSTFPTKWVFEGQTVSGLLGPVRLSFSR